MTRWAALSAQLTLAKHQLAKDSTTVITITVEDDAMLRRLEGQQQPATRPGPSAQRRAATPTRQPGQQHAAAPPGAASTSHGPSGRKRPRNTAAEPARPAQKQALKSDKSQPGSELVILKVKFDLAALRRSYPDRLILRGRTAATPHAMLLRAWEAARLGDLDVRVVNAVTDREISVPQWDELRTWDPGD